MTTVSQIPDSPTDTAVSFAATTQMEQVVQKIVAMAGFLKKATFPITRNIVCFRMFFPSEGDAFFCENECTFKNYIQC